MADSKHGNNHDDEDVVVIEEKDKKSLWLIGLAGVLGVGLGFVLGVNGTTQKWQMTVDELETRYQTLVEDKKNWLVSMEKQVAKVDQTAIENMQLALDGQKSAYEEKLIELNQQLIASQAEKEALKIQLETLASRLEVLDSDKHQLERRTESNELLFARARELFQRELLVKQQLEALEQEKSALTPQLEKFERDCTAYLDRSDWDVTKDSCDQQDAASSRLSQVNQMIQVHRMDLEQIQSIADELGL